MDDVTIEDDVELNEQEFPRSSSKLNIRKSFFIFQFRKYFLKIKLEFLL